MKQTVRGKNIIIDGEIFPATAFSSLPENNIYYEVIRLAESRYVFYEDHLQRLANSCEENKRVHPDLSQIRNSLQRIPKLNHFKSGNVKLIVYAENGQTRHACYFIPHKYPKAQEYETGVVVKTFPFERPDPKIKQWFPKFRKDVSQFISDLRIYEAFLINEQGYITEGSRSNVFFIDHEGTVFTAPEDVVLPGITRKYVLKICRENKINIIFQQIHWSALQAFDACFISGTSPKVLPVRQIDTVLFNPSHHTLQLIMKQYDRLISAK